jgi:elongation factor P--(R)-beta-lysine ligase
VKDFRQFRIRKNLEKRARIIAAVRGFFIDTDYLEVETPIRVTAPAPEAHIDAVSSGDGYLHTSPELCMKRLLSAGYSRIFQICKCFRGHERGHRHLPEFTLLEWYRARTDYRDMMETCEDLVLHAAGSAGIQGVLSWQGKTVDLKKTWPRLSVEEAFDGYASMSLEQALEEGAFDEVLALEIEPFLGVPKPVFLHDYPVQKGAFARIKADDPRFVERFELYIAGMEICNAFSELRDATHQRNRFEAENDLRRQMGKTEYPLPERFLDVLPQMPEASGNALGLDRLVMLLCDAATIDEVTAFVPEEI